MAQNCYLSATSTIHQDRASEIIGPCGPCSWINLLNLNGSFKLEKELAQIGRLKPFYASTFISYILWAKKYGVDVDVYSSSFEISDGTFEMMFNYEKIPEEKRDVMRLKAKELVANIVSEYKSNLHLLKVPPLELIDELLDGGFRVAFNVACLFPPHDKLLGHARVCLGKENGRYIILDSYFGKLNYTEKELIDDFDNVKLLGGTYYVVAYKK